MKSNRHTIETMTFPGGEPHVSSNPELFEAIAQECANFGSDLRIIAKVESFNDIGAMMVLKDLADRTFPEVPVDLVIPYLPGARQDRGAPLTCKIYADIINGMNFRAVWTIDPHSDVMPAMIDRLQVISQYDAFKNSLSEMGPLNNLRDTVLVAPDQGAAKRVEAFAAQTGHTVVYAQKHRDFSTGKLSGFSCEPIPLLGTSHTQVVILDDICDGGGTFLGLADVLEYEDGRKVQAYNRHLVITHGIFSKGITGLLQSFATVTCTNSLSRPYYSNGTAGFKIVELQF